LIDAGSPGQVQKFRKAVARLPVQLHDIQLIVLTHGHWDHIGSAKAIQEATGGKLALHQLEKDCLERSLKPLPPGVTSWGRIFITMAHAITPFIRIPAADVDVVLGNEEFSLDKYGIPGRILHTPGHTAGSVSVVLDTAEAFVGDLAMGVLPLRLRPGLTILAEDMDQVRESWRMLLHAGVQTIYPAHGRPFPADVIRRALN
jgi:glyoxylase-like metal-dependent hydrolase (beta-lactamase superfamily II)